MYTLYAFARITDDLGDSDEPSRLKAKWLDAWRKTTALNLLAEPQTQAVLVPEVLAEDRSKASIRLIDQAQRLFPALRDTTTRFQIPSRYLLEIIDGVLADQQKSRFDTYEQLEHYCYLVASAVGLACLHIWGFKEPLPLQSAIDCGLAFQITNVLRDVAEDARRGRIYLPRQHYEQHGLCEDDLLSSRKDDRIRCLVLDEVQRTKQLYNSGWHVWESLDEDGRPMFSMMWRTYRRLLTRIEQNPSEVVVRRLSLTWPDRLGIVSQHFLPMRFRRLPVPPQEVMRI